MLRKLLKFIHANDLLHAGNRLGVAVSGGADSVALLRALLELRGKLGLVLSVVHVHHQIRAEADADAEFVARLAEQHGLELNLLHADVPAVAREKRIGLEAAGREVRYRYFSQLMAGGTLDKVATAHTFDDQAETVLLRIIRGAGLQGIGGIHAQRKLKDDGEVIRPMLGISRVELIEYLQKIGQDWREDATNADVALARNRVRHELLPMLEQQYNPAIRQALVNLGEIAKADNGFLADRAVRLFDEVCDREAREVRIVALLEEPVALQRQLLIVAAESFTGVRAEFDDIEGLRRVADGVITGFELDKGHRVERVRSSDGGRLRFVHSDTNPVQVADYDFELLVPGEVRIAELNSVVRARLVDLNSSNERYNPAELLEPSKLCLPLRLRNYRPGDRFHPLRSKSAEKLKRLFVEKKIPQESRQVWPVVLSGEDIVWVRGFPVSAEYAVPQGSVSGVLIQASLTTPGGDS